MSLTSSLQISGTISGSNLLNLTVKKAPNAYKEGIDGVGRNDQYKRGGPDLLQKLITKRYKKLTSQFWSS